MCPQQSSAPCLIILLCCRNINANLVTRAPSQDFRSVSTSLGIYERDCLKNGDIYGLDLLIFKFLIGRSQRLGKVRVQSTIICFCVLKEDEKFFLAVK